ncbi:MAG: PAS domain S-box protein, partial [Candidatus Caldatribacteriota bacterium]|nr:PAS domain S-box protein [Candidatus Caldatribacteriota bacterium]
MKTNNKTNNGIQQKLFELKQTKKELKEIEALQLSILNSVPHAVIGLKNREITFANEFVKNVFGWKPKDLIGKNSRILYPSDKEFEKIGKYFYPKLKKYQNYNGEFSCRRRDGTNIICKVTVSRIGKILKDKKIVVTYEDITKRKKSKEILQKSQQEFASLFNNSPEAAVYHNEKGIILNINTRFTELFGYSLEEIKGKNINEGMIFPQNNTIKESEELTKLALKGKVVTRETIRKKKDNSLISVIISVAPVITEGQYKGVVAFYQDVTESKKIREELQKSKEGYQLLLENQDDLVTKIDPDGRYLFVSPSYCHAYGKTE